MNSMRWLLLAAALSGGLMACTDQAVRVPALAERTLSEASPAPELAPGEVVRIQLGALQRNAALPGDGGIRVAFRFASAANRASIGPVERFIGLLHGPRYGAMLDHRSATFGDVVREGERAAQPVTLTTRDFRTASYVFMLRREASRECPAGCWVTESVYVWPVEDTAPRRVNV